jgi:type II secretory pathway pseudopilin PulG
VTTILPPFPQSAGAEAGFTLLEGLVAIALLAGTMFAIFTLVGGVLSSANSVGRSNETAQVTLNALEVMSAVNPMLQETGKIDLGPYAVSWKSAAATPIADGTGYPVGTSLYQLALYNTNVRVEGPQSTLLAAFDLRQVGYRRVRDPTPPLREGLPGIAARGR